MQCCKPRSGRCKRHGKENKIIGGEKNGCERYSGGIGLLELCDRGDLSPAGPSQSSASLNSSVWLVWYYDSMIGRLSRNIDLRHYRDCNLNNPIRTQRDRQVVVVVHTCKFKRVRCDLCEPLQIKSCVSVLYFQKNSSVMSSLKTYQRTDATARLYWMLKLEQLAAKFDFGFSFSPPIKGVWSKDMVVSHGKSAGKYKKMLRKKKYKLTALRCSCSCPQNCVYSYTFCTTDFEKYA